MKRFLPLFILTSFLFGQDVLTLKNGESYKGTFYGKVDEDIVFKVEGETSTKKYSIWDVASIKTVNNEYFYPFDDPNLKSTEYKEWDYVSPLEPVLKPVLKPVLLNVMYVTLTLGGCYLLVILYIQASVGTGSGG